MEERLESSPPSQSLEPEGLIAFRLQRAAASCIPTAAPPIPQLMVLRWLLLEHGGDEETRRRGLVEGPPVDTRSRG